MSLCPRRAEGTVTILEEYRLSDKITGMAGFADRYPLNVPGKFYVDVECTDCGLCRGFAPNNVRRDDRLFYSYIFKQPENDEEMVEVREALDGCPHAAVRDDGDRHDWDKEPILDWNAIAVKGGHGSIFDIKTPLIPNSES